ncbi:MAG: multicopper oxidase domain-containing protein, partial [Ferruginibacter sp.]|nr:multicopper oxidase domain-containing protein [Ferruginibacter sp.]
MKKFKLIMLLLTMYSFATAQDMKGMDMSNKEIKSQPQATTYTCVMHPEIHASKPGNCPKCGMKLVKEKPKQQKGAGQKNNEMKMPDGKAHNNEDTSKMAMDKMTMEDTAKGKKMDMGNMPMDNMGNMQMPKADVGRIKTIVNTTAPHTVRYDLYVRDTTVTFGKKPTKAIAVNGQIPMPTLTFTEGDTAEIWVHNDLDEETTMHWHGLFLPNRYDGVPFLTQKPIMPHTSYLYKFPIVQHGTHWYHSHSGLQEQIGMYGAFIMNKRKEWDIPTIPVVLSDWINMNPKEVNRSLHNQTDWFGIKKN